MLEEKLGKALNKILGDYVPNKVDMDNLTNYLYKLIVFLSKDVDMSEEYKNIKSFNQLDEDGFKKAIKDIALFTSQRVMLETLNKTYKEMRNTVPVVKIDRSKGFLEYGETPNKKETIKSSMVAEPEFQIDLSAVPKVKKIEKTKEEVQVRVIKTVAPEFDSSGLIDLDKVNKNPSSTGISNDNEDDNDTDLTLGAGLVGGAKFNSVPDIDVSLDY